MVLLVILSHLSHCIRQATRSQHRGTAERVLLPKVLDIRWQTALVQARLCPASLTMLLIEIGHSQRAAYLDLRHVFHFQTI